MLKRSRREERPAYAKPRRMPPEMQVEIRENAEEMLKNKIIRPSESPWNCPIILLKKKGKSRFVSDFRELNKKTKSDTYPLPNIKDCIERMEGAKFSTPLMQLLPTGLLNWKKKTVRRPLSVYLTGSLSLMS